MCTKWGRRRMPSISRCTVHTGFVYVLHNCRCYCILGGVHFVKVLALSRLRVCRKSQWCAFYQNCSPLPVENRLSTAFRRFLFLTLDRAVGANSNTFLTLSVLIEKNKSGTRHIGFKGIILFKNAVANFTNLWYT